jgi:hypothetical protein
VLQTAPSLRHGCRERQCASHFAITNSSMKVHRVVFQLKGSSLLWWKTILLQLNMAIKDVSWELFEERLRERTRASGSVGTNTMGYLGNAYQIHAVVNNHQIEN